MQKENDGGRSRRGGRRSGWQQCEGLLEEEVYDRAIWKCAIVLHRPRIKVGLR